MKFDKKKIKKWRANISFGGYLTSFGQKKIRGGQDGQIGEYGPEGHLLGGDQLPGWWELVFWHLSFPHQYGVRESK